MRNTDPVELIPQSQMSETPVNPIEALKEIAENDSFDNSETKYKFTSLQELMKTEFPPIQWLINDILPEGLTILSAKAKAGKTRLALLWSIAVASGELLNGFQGIKGDVLFIQLDDSARNMQERIREIQSHFNLDLSGCNIDFAYEFPRQKQGLELIQSKIDNNPNIKFVVIDTLSKFVDKQNKRDVMKEEYELISQIRTFANTHKIGILLLHHLNKNLATNDIFDTISGTTGNQAGTDSNLVLQKKIDVFKLHGQGRNLPPIEYRLGFDNGIWNRLENNDEKSQNQARNQIIELLQKATTPLTPKDVSTTLALSWSYAKNQLSTMAKLNEIDRVGRGKYQCKKNESPNIFSK